MTKYLFLTCLFLCITACKNDSTKNNSTDELSSSNSELSINTFVSSIEKAHKKEHFLKESAIQLQLNIQFGGNERLNGTVTFSTDSSKGKLELSNGDTIIYIDNEVFYSPSITNTQRIRFDAYTWSYFLLFPYKLSDDGTVWNSYPNSQLGDIKYNAQKLSFKSGVGDAPDDWYVVYSNPNSNLLEVAAYIVTSGKTIEEAEADPHAIKYEDFVAVNNIPFARKWTFWEWEAKLGLTHQIGEATLKNIKFIEDQKLFEVPQDFLKN
ncbi:DUF6503 family protein [Hanstruepera ponticola]|uniref:DUF6503 family protein n=1 Tax=Hanstruepera ponticola TaxID=2042995 RepID=UPI000CF06B57|nr:DUF6503 family protein [Hanstruepera ponticola]